MGVIVADKRRSPDSLSVISAIVVRTAEPRPIGKIDENVAIAGGGVGCSAQCCRRSPPRGGQPERPPRSISPTQNHDERHLSDRSSSKPMSG